MSHRLQTFHAENIPRRDRISEDPRNRCLGAGRSAEQVLQSERCTLRVEGELQTVGHLARCRVVMLWRLAIKTGFVFSGRVMSKWSCAELVFLFAVVNRSSCAWSNSNYFIFEDGALPRTRHTFPTDGKKIAFFTYVQAFVLQWTRSCLSVFINVVKHR